MVRKLKGLEHVISMTLLLPTFRNTKPQDDHAGWVFATSKSHAHTSNGTTTNDEEDEDVTYYTNPQGKGGPFPTVLEGCEPDPEFGAFSLRDIYDHAAAKSSKQAASGPFTVPVLWD